MSGNVSAKVKKGETMSLWAWAPAVASLSFSAATAWLSYLYLDAHNLAYHQRGESLEYHLPDLVQHEELLGSARIVTALIAVILAVIAFRGGPRWMAWLSLIIGLLGFVSLPWFTLM